jgi:hypothetical protein
MSVKLYLNKLKIKNLILLSLDNKELSHLLINLNKVIIKLLIIHLIKVLVNI